MDNMEIGSAAHEMDFSIAEPYPNSALRSPEGTVSVGNPFIAEYLDLWDDALSVEQLTPGFLSTPAENPVQTPFRPDCPEYIETSISDAQLSLMLDTTLFDDDWMNLDTDLDLSNNPPEPTYTAGDGKDVNKDHSLSTSCGVGSRRTVLNRSQKEILTGWVAQNSEPYPSRDNKISLAALTGLTVTQINGWFTRTRQRAMQRIDKTGNAVFPPKPQAREHSILTGSTLIDGQGRKSDSMPDRARWSSISLPERSRQSLVKDVFERPRSLPPFFSLDHVRLLSSFPSYPSRDGLSLRVVASTRRMAASTTSREGSTASRGYNKDVNTAACPAGPHDISKSNSVEAWIRDVSRYANSSSKDHALRLEEKGSPYGYTAVTAQNADKAAKIQSDRQSSHAGSDCRIEASIQRRSQMTTEHWHEPQNTVAGATSACSYTAFGPRKGRRVVFKPLQTFRGFLDETVPPTDQPTSVIREIPRSLNTTLPKHNSGDTQKHGEELATPSGTKYTCTFCRKEFAAAYIWKRHEVSIHAPQVQWVCGLNMPSGQDATSSCLICTKGHHSGNATTTSPSCSHRFAECWEKPKSERAFFRKDTLKQHIYTVHLKGDSALLAGTGFDIRNWMEMTDEGRYDLACHFCGFTCENWETRASHLIEHFNNGVSMDLWIPQGPYALMPDGHSIPEIANTGVGWRCLLNIADYDPALTDNYWRAFIWTCSLCGFKIDFLREPEPESTLHHLRSVHDLMTDGHCWQNPATFSSADEFVEHLITGHSAKQGDWMAGLMLAAQKELPHG